MCLTICENYNNGYCLKYSESCFNQCVQSQKRGANINCYEVVRHEKGTSYEMDKSISQDTCLTKEQAIAIVSDLNSVKHSQMKYKYYWRMRTK